MAVSPSRSIDPFDIHWTVVDPLDREVSMLRSVEKAREGRHRNPPEYLSAEDVKVVVEEPDRIDESVSSAYRDVYYKRDAAEDYPYSRAVVDFRDSATKGLVISWSRYEKTVASYGVKYRKDEP